MQVFAYHKPKREFTALGFDATGRHLAAGGGDDNTVVWDTVTGAEHGRHQATHPQPLNFSPVGNRLVLPTRFGLWVHDLGEEGSFARYAVPSHVGPLAVHPTRDLAVFYRNDGNRTGLSAVSLDSPDPESAWDAPIGDLPAESGYSVGLVSLGEEAFVSAEGLGQRRIASYRFRLALRAWADGRLIRSFSGDLFNYGDRIFGSPAHRAVVVQSGIWLRIQRTDVSGEPPRLVRNDGRKHFTGAAFHPSGRFLAATSNDATVKLFDTTTWEVARAFTWDVGRMRSIAFSPNGTLAAAGSDTGKVVVWDVDL